MQTGSWQINRSFPPHTIFRFFKSLAYVLKCAVSGADHLRPIFLPQDRSRGNKGNICRSMTDWQHTGCLDAVTSAMTRAK
jgi:hypothetical protein